MCMHVQVSMYTLETLVRHLPAVLPPSWAPRPLRRLRTGHPPPGPLPWPDASIQVGTACKAIFVDCRPRVQSFTVERSRTVIEFPNPALPGGDFRRPLSTPV